MRSLATLLVAFALSPAAPTQELLWERVGTKGVVQFGGTIVAIGDVNADGYEDLVHRVNRNLPGGETQLWTLSGKDGKTLRKRRWIADCRPFHNLAPAGDWDGDGVRDYIVRIGDWTTQRRNNIVEVRSGKDDRLLWQVTGPWSHFGYAILGDLDLDGDKKPDLVVTDLRENDRGAFYAYSNQGKLLYRVAGTHYLKFLGWSLGKVGDVDRDGRDDYVVGGAEPSSRGMGILVSGATGKTIVVGMGLLGEWIGDTADGCGDLDGDGVLDFVVGSSGGIATKSIVRAFSGKTGKTIRAFPMAAAYGLSSRGIDMDRDGVPDIVVGDSTAPPPIGYLRGSVVVFSGRDGSILVNVSTPKTSVGTTLGIYVTAMLPQPGSPFGVFAACEPRWKSTGTYPNYLGRLRVFRASPAGVKVFGAACQGTLPTTPKVGLRDLSGKAVRIHLSDAAAGSPAALLLGLSRTRWGPIPLPLALDPFGFPGCKLYTSVDLILATSTGSTGLSKGYAFIDLPLRLSSTGKLTLHGQWLSLGLGKLAPGALSDAVLWRSQ